MAKELRRVYLDNDPWLADEENRVFRDERDTPETIPFEDGPKRGFHYSSLRIVVIKGYPYYDDERLKQFRRVGEPSFVLTYDQFDLLPEGDRRLTIPRGEAFKKVMAKEKAYWKRRRHDAEADKGRGR
jgi:hypothetical protein